MTFSTWGKPSIMYLSILSPSEGPILFLFNNSFACFIYKLKLLANKFNKNLSFLKSLIISWDSFLYLSIISNIIE